MKINFMTWNTQLYEYGNRISSNNVPKPINKELCKNVFDIVKTFLEKENAIVVLQEIPLNSNINNDKHVIFNMLNEYFPKTQYYCLYNINENVRNQIKMTVIISKDNLIERDMNGINSTKEDYCNCYVSFNIKNTTLRVLGVHSHNAYELLGKLKTYYHYQPNIILGDFNAGNYKYVDKEQDAKFIANRKNYLAVIEGFIDVCQGMYTTKYKTHIDHVLVENSNKFLEKYKINNVIVDREITFSDHFPITFEISIE